MTSFDEHSPARANPVALARRSAAEAKKLPGSGRIRPGHPYRTFRARLSHLGTLTRNQLTCTSTQTMPMLAEPTSD